MVIKTVLTAVTRISLNAGQREIRHSGLLLLLLPGLLIFTFTSSEQFIATTEPVPPVAAGAPVATGGSRLPFLLHATG